MTHDVAGRAGLLEILSWARPHDSVIERAFCREYLDPIRGMSADGFGNRMLAIGERPEVLWSCHVDTVAHRDGHQDVGIDAHRIARLCSGRSGMSLGADDGAGVWIMLNMIAAGKPGLYLFHRGEELGCLGSTWIRRNNPGLLEGIAAAIAFDRAGSGDVITHQSSGRTCSNGFALSIAAALNDLADAVAEYPFLAARILCQCGVTLDDFLTEVWAEEAGDDFGYRPLMTS